MHQRLSLVTAAVALLALGACSNVATDDAGYHTQRARVGGGMEGGMFGGGRSACDADDIAGCGGVADRDTYQRLGADGKLRFIYPDGTTRTYQPQASLSK